VDHPGAGVVLLKICGPVEGETVVPALGIGFLPARAWNKLQDGEQELVAKGPRVTERY